MVKDLRLIFRDRSAIVTLLLVPIIVIVFVAESQHREREKVILFPVVDDDEGPVASVLIEVLREHLDVRVVDRSSAERMVALENRAAAYLVLPAGLSKRYLTERSSTLELYTDPAQWTAIQAIKVVLLLADREAAALGDPFKEELIDLREQSITGRRIKFSSVEQNVPGFSVMFVLLSLVYGVAFGMRDEEGWGTGGRLAVAPLSRSAVLAGKVLARGLVGAAQLSILLLFGHLVYRVSLGAHPEVLLLVIPAVALAMASFSVLVAAIAKTREQILPVGLAVVFVLATLGGSFWPYSELPHWMQVAGRGLVTTWSLFSLQDVMLRDRGLVEMAPRLAVLMAYGVLSFLIGARIFRYTEP